MDNLWERSIPFYKVNIKDAESIFKEYNNSLEILDLTAINIGCRNSNYKITTDNGLFLLRICPLGDTSWEKEKIISELLSKDINVPRLLFSSEDNITQRVCLIYEFIDGCSLQQSITANGTFEDNIITQAAETAAHIHNFDVINNGEFTTLDNYPPFLMWYDLFLENDAAAMRIGNDDKERIKKLISAKQDDLNVIAQYTSFIHSDFRPANMLVDKNNKIWIVDWEFSGFGHRLADIGQFFRYSNCFNSEQIRKFEEMYNRISKKPLPDNWYDLSKLRDLVNPLQMIGTKEDLPEKYKDLKNLILDTLNFFGY